MSRHELQRVESWRARASEREGMFRPKLSELPPVRRTGWRTTRLRPIDRARRGSALGQMTISVHILMNSLNK